MYEVPNKKKKTKRLDHWFLSYEVKRYKNIARIGQKQAKGTVLVNGWIYILPFGTTRCVLANSVWENHPEPVKL